MNPLPHSLEMWLQHAEGALALRERLADCGCRDGGLLARLDEHAARLATRVAAHVSVHDDVIRFKDPIE